MQGVMNPMNLTTARMGPNMFPKQQYPAPKQTAMQGQGVTVYVGNLPKEAIEQSLTEFFQEFSDSLKGIKVMRDHFTGESRRFAFATLAGQEQAEAFIEKFNFANYQGFELIVAIKKSSVDFKEDANVFVKNLPENMTSRQLEQEGKNHGNVVSAIVKYDPDTAKTLGYGYIQYSNSEEAQACIDQLNGQELGGKTVEAQIFLSKAKRGIKTRNNLYIKNFPEEWDKQKVEEFIKEFFESFGKITSVGIQYSETNKNHCAFVCYEKPEDAKRAMEETNEQEIEDKRLYVNFAQTKSARKKMWNKASAGQNQTNIYIKGVKEEVNEQVIKEAFSIYGEITSTCLKRKSLKKQGEEVQSGFAFINFRSADQALKAYTEGKENADIKELVDMSLVRNGDFLFYAQTKGVRKQYLKTQKRNQTPGMTPAIQKLMATFLRMSGGRNSNPQQMQQMLSMMMAGMGKGRQMRYPQNNRGYRGGNFMNNNMPMGMNPMGNMNPMMGMQGMQPNYGGFNNMSMRQGMMPSGGGLMNDIGNNQMPMGAAYGRQGASNPQFANQEAPAKKKPSSVGGVHNIDWIVANKGEFNDLDDDVKKRSLGTILFPLIQELIKDKPNAGELTPKVTGMLIDLDVLTVDDIIESIQNTSILQQRVTEAIELIHEDMNENQ